VTDSGEVGRKPMLSVTGECRQGNFVTIEGPGVASPTCELRKYEWHFRRVTPRQCPPRVGNSAGLRDTLGVCEHGRGAVRGKARWFSRGGSRGPKRTARATGDFCLALGCHSHACHASHRGCATHTELMAPTPCPPCRRAPVQICPDQKVFSRLPLRGSRF
jgi:hypothetical protein